MAATFVNYAILVTAPFIISAAFHYAGAWIGIPTFIVGSIFWLGAIFNQYKRETEIIKKQKDTP